MKFRIHSNSFKIKNNSILVLYTIWMNFKWFYAFSWISWFLTNLVILTPKARRRSRLATKWSDSKRPYLEIDASSDANSFEIEKLRLSAFQFWCFLLNLDLKTTSKGRWRIGYKFQCIRRKFITNHSIIFCSKFIRLTFIFSLPKFIQKN